MRKIKRQDGFTLTELLVATTVMLLVLGGALTTVRNAVMINDSASQLADANQNIRAGTNTLVRDVMMAGRIIGAEGISMPGGITFKRPGPPGSNLNFNLVASSDPNDPTLQLPSISTGYQLGPVIRGSATDIITIVTVDEFMPVVTTPPAIGGAPTATEGTLAGDGSSVTFAANSVWLLGDTVSDTPKIEIGDLVLLKGQNGNTIQTVTAKTATTISFQNGAAQDFFKFNPTTPTTGVNRPLTGVKQVGSTLCPWLSVCPPTAAVLQTSAGAWAAPVTLFKAVMITYYVDNSNPTTPRLTRQVNKGGCVGCPTKFDPQALAGVVEDLDITYDLYDGACNPTEVTALPYTTTCLGNAITYTEGMIRKVNLHVGVRSETMSKPLQDYVRSHISTSVNVRSLTSVDRYNQ